MSTINKVVPFVLEEESLYKNGPFIFETSSNEMLSDPLLLRITHPRQLMAFSLEQLACLSDEIRKRLISTVAKNGGHLAPSLGVVELTLAILSVFDAENDKIIWDVGHQAYAYKLLTGRADQFHTLRQVNGLSGFPRRSESCFDHFGGGHSSTSISAGLGMACARDIKHENHHIISIIGDGSLTAGLAFEGLNQAGGKKRPFIVILNDNEMSISKNVGALSLFMSRNLSARWVRRVKKEVEGFLKSIPGIGDDLYEIAKRSKHSFKNFFTPGILFEALNFNYIGVVDGHNIEELQKVLRLAKTLEKPVLIHVLTQKGRGYAPAEQNPVLFHGVGKFEVASGEILVQPEGPTYTQVFGTALCAMAEQDPRVVAITAAMPEGTGLSAFAEKFPERFFDVGICEQHAVTFAAGLATQGFKPFVAVYSTFMQRAYDQIVHDVCLQNLPVTFCLDRAGFVGEDGPTHHGVFDLAYLRHIPNIRLFAPKDQEELCRGLASALAHNGPFGLRYPRALVPGAFYQPVAEPFEDGEGEQIFQGNSGVALISLGHCFTAVREAACMIREEGLSCTLINARWVKPLPEKTLTNAINAHDKIILIEEHALAGGFSSAVLEFFLDAGLLRGQIIKRIGLADVFFEHGPSGYLRKSAGIDPLGICQKIRQLF